MIRQFFCVTVCLIVVGASTNLVGQELTFPARFQSQPTQRDSAADTLQVVVPVEQPTTAANLASEELASEELVAEGLADVELEAEAVSYSADVTDTGCGCGSFWCRGQCSNAKAAQNAYKGLFYLNDFSYLNSCDNDCFFFGDRLKQLPMPHCGTLDLGGQLRLRYHDEWGMKGSQRFLANQDDFLLTRLRLFANYQMNDVFRFYVEGLLADSAFQRFPPRPIDENSMDFSNFLLDAKLTQAMTVRAGRQELLYGAQRLVSPLDWANTRRTFEGMRLLHHTSNLKVDGFYTHFVPVRAYDWDNADYRQPFYGLYGTYSGLERSSIDFYYLGYDNRGTGLSLHTLGSRIFGSDPCTGWQWEVEGATQFGARSTGVDQQGEGFITAGFGRKRADWFWKPSLWLYFDYASENFNQLFPLAHKYLGFIDAVARTNIQTPNVQLTLSPNERWTLLFWYYYFESATGAPVPAIGGTPSQNNGRFLGHELDFLATYRLTPRANLQFGYSHFWRGSKINNPEDADFIYSHIEWNF